MLQRFRDFWQDWGQDPLYFRMRRMTKARPLKLERMWIGPAIFLAVTALVLIAPGPHGEPHHWALQALAWLVPSQLPTGHRFHVTRPLWRSSSPLGWSFG